VGERTTVGGITVIATTAEAGPASVGLVTGRSLGGAVVRNRVRRRLREALAQAGPPPGFDLVVLAGREVIEAPFDRLVEWLQRAMPKEDR